MLVSTRAGSLRGKWDVPQTKGAGSQGNGYPKTKLLNF